MPREKASSTLPCHLFFFFFQAKKHTQQLMFLLLSLSVMHTHTHTEASQYIQMALNNENSFSSVIF